MDFAKHLSELSSGELQELANGAKIKEETEKLAAKLANHLTILSHLKLDRASETSKPRLTEGLHGAFCEGLTTKYYYLVSFDDPQIPPKELDIQIRKWVLQHWSGSGFAQSYNIDLYINYTSNLGGSESSELTWTVHSPYEDPGIAIRQSSHGGTKTMLKKVLDELDPSSTLTEIQFLELLLNEDGKTILGEEVEDPVSDEEGKTSKKLVTLRDVIEHEIVFNKRI